MKFRRAVLAAIEILQAEAHLIHECSTDEYGEWGGDEAAKKSHDRMIFVAKELRRGVNDPLLMNGMELLAQTSATASVVAQETA
ncbi:MAG: hypothetical protein IPO08_23250 [Xanthomonadales bacterium]|nr:hypothetical protein [Xanthomonadales bacterium]